MLCCALGAGDGYTRNLSRKPKNLLRLHRRFGELLLEARLGQKEEAAVDCHCVTGYSCSSQNPSSTVALSCHTMNLATCT